MIRWQLLSSPSVEFLASVAEVRMIVEPGAARLAAHRRQPEDLERLDTGLEAMGCLRATTLTPWSRRTLLFTALC